MMVIRFLAKKSLVESRIHRFFSENTYGVNGTPKFINVLNTRDEHDKLSCLKALFNARKTSSLLI